MSQERQSSSCCLITDLSLSPINGMGVGRKVLEISVPFIFFENGNTPPVGPGQGSPLSCPGAGLFITALYEAPTPTSTAPRHQACCLLAKAPPLSHASPLARPPPSCRSRLRRSPFPPSAAPRTGHAKLGRIWSTRLPASSLRPHPGRMRRRPSSFRDIPTARRLARRNSALAPPAPLPVDRRETVQQG